MHKFSIFTNPISTLTTPDSQRACTVDCIVFPGTMQTLHSQLLPRPLSLHVAVRPHCALTLTFLAFLRAGFTFRFPPHTTQIYTTGVHYTNQITDHTLYLKPHFSAAQRAAHTGQHTTTTVMRVWAARCGDKQNTERGETATTRPAREELSRSPHCSPEPRLYGWAAAACCCCWACCTAA